MLVLEGLQDAQAAELAYWQGLQWGLFVSNYTVTSATVLADITAIEASWTGYARQTVSPWTAPTPVSGGSQTGGSALLTFNNTSGSPATFYGWFACNNTTGKLIGALNIGLQTLPSGSPYSFAAALNDQNTGP